jgi:hypothetical protein
MGETGTITNRVQRKARSRQLGVYLAADKFTPFADNRRGDGHGATPAYMPRTDRIRAQCCLSFVLRARMSQDESPGVGWWIQTFSSANV